MTQIRTPKISVNIESANLDLSVAGPTVVPPPVPFCGVPSYNFAGPFPKTLTIVQTGVTNEVTITAGAGGGFGGISPTVASKSTTGNLSIEVTFKSNTGGNAGILGCGHNQLIQTGILATGIGILLQGGGMGQLFDFVSSTFIGPSFPISYPFTISIKLNQAAATATFEFKDGVNPDQSAVANVNAGYDNTKFTYLFSITTGLGANDVVVIDMNGGSEAFILDNSDGKYCDYEFKIFCPFDDVTLHNQSGTVEAETGFINVEGSLATTDLILNTPISATSGIAKSEIFFALDANASISEKLSVAFVSANSASPTVFAELTIDPIQQTVFDEVGSTTKETGVVMVAGIYKIWIELDLSNGTVTYTDILGNTGSLSVTGYTSGDNVFYKYKAIADTLSNSKLVAGYDSGATDFANGLGTGKCNL